MVFSLFEGKGIMPSEFLAMTVKQINMIFDRYEIKNRKEIREGLAQQLIDEVYGKGKGKRR